MCVCVCVCLCVHTDTTLSSQNEKKMQKSNRWMLHSVGMTQGSVWCHPPTGGRHCIVLEGSRFTSSPFIVINPALCTKPSLQRQKTCVFLCLNVWVRACECIQTILAGRWPPGRASSLASLAAHITVMLGSKHTWAKFLSPWLQWEQSCKPPFLCQY